MTVPPFGSPRGPSTFRGHARKSTAERLAGVASAAAPHRAPGFASIGRIDRADRDDALGLGCPRRACKQDISPRMGSSESEPKSTSFY